MNEFIKSQQELAREKMTRHTMWRDNEMKLLERHFDDLIAQIITNTGEEQLKRVSNEEVVCSTTYERIIREVTGVCDHHLEDNK